MDREACRLRWKQREEEWRTVKVDYERRQTLGRQLEIAWDTVAREYYLADPGLESHQQPCREVFAHLRELLVEARQLQHIRDIRHAANEAYLAEENDATREFRAAECGACDLILCCDDVDWWSAKAADMIQWDRSLSPWMSEPSDPVDHVKASVRDHEWDRSGTAVDGNSDRRSSGRSSFEVQVRRHVN